MRPDISVEGKEPSYEQAVEKPVRNPLRLPGHEKSHRADVNASALWLFSALTGKLQQGREPAFTGSPARNSGRLRPSA